MNAPRQARQILAELQQGPATVDQLRDRTGIAQPGTRVAELRKAGWPIVTIRLPDQRSSTYILADKREG